MSKRLVCLCHLVRIFTLLACTAGSVECIKDLTGQSFLHGLLVALSGVLGDPSQAESLLSLGTDLHRYLIGRTAETAGLDLELRHDVLHCLLKNLQRISAGGDPKDGCFVTTRYFKADNGFKFSTINVADDWSKAFGGMTTNSENITFDGDGNAHVPSDGLWTITLDYTKDEMTLTEGMIYGMGPAFNDDWTMAKYAGEINADGTATIVALSDGALRVYAPCAFDWWQHEFQPDADGNLVYREGGELEAFNVTAGQKITFNFNAGTATVE